MLDNQTLNVIKENRALIDDIVRIFITYNLHTKGNNNTIGLLNELKVNKALADLKYTLCSVV